MSKSKKNVVDPEFIINNYGADSVRLFILSDSPPEKDVQWSEQGMVSSYKFIQKLWLLHSEIKKKLSNENQNSFKSIINRKKNQDKKLKNLFYVGGTVRPGGGMPLAAKSGIDTANMILNDED